MAWILLANINKICNSNNHFNVNGTKTNFNRISAEDRQNNWLSIKESTKFVLLLLDQFVCNFSTFLRLIFRMKS